MLKLLIVKNYFINYHFFLKNLILYKFFSKFIYVKFLVIKKCWRLRNKNFLFIDNFFEIAYSKLKKKYKKLGLSSKIRTGFFLKQSFIYLNILN